MVQNIIISKEKMDLINNLLALSGEQIYQKYGFKRDETITHTAAFPNGIEADIKLVICAEESPYVEGILYDKGCEVMHTDCMDTYAGGWCFFHKGKEYVVNVTTSDRPLLIA